MQPNYLQNPNQNLNYAPQSTQTQQAVSNPNNAHNQNLQHSQLMMQQQAQQPIDHSKEGGGNIIYLDSMPDIINCVLQPRDGGRRGGLFIGGLESATNLELLKQHKIEAVLTITANINVTYPKNFKVAHESIYAEDNIFYKLSDHFEHFFGFLD